MNWISLAGWGAIFLMAVAFVVYGVLLFLIITFVTLGVLLLIWNTFEPVYGGRVRQAMPKPLKDNAWTFALGLGWMAAALLVEKSSVDNMLAHGTNMTEVLWVIFVIGCLTGVGSIVGVVFDLLRKEKEARYQ